MSRKSVEYTVEDFYFIKVGPLWRYFWSEHPAFWFICGYLFIEYFRPQSIYPVIDILPWAQLFLLGAMGLMFFDKKSSLVWTSTHFWVLLFTLQIQLSIQFSYNEDFAKANHVNFYQWVIIYFVVTTIITTRERFYIFLMVFYLCTLKLAIGTAKIWVFRGFAFTGWGIAGPPGFFQNSGELAIQMVILFCLSLYLLKAYGRCCGRIEKIILLTGLIAPVMTILGASSRGSQIALFIVVLVYFSKDIFKPKILVSFVTIVGLLWFFIPDEQKARFEGMGEDRTSEQRLLYWSNGLEMIAENPFLGVGYYNFIPYYTDHYSEDILFVNPRGEIVAELPHNIFIQLGTDAGIPAILMIIMIFLSAIKGISNPEFKKIASGLSLGLMGFFIAGQFVTVMYYPFFWISITLLVCLKNSNKIRHKNKHMDMVGAV